VSALAVRLGFGLDGLARRVAVWGALLVAAAFAWTVTLRCALEMGNGPGTMGRSLAGFVLLWTVMMAAMMLPSVAPGLGVAFGIGLVVLACVVPAHPGLAPGLHLGGGVSM